MRRDNVVSLKNVIVVVLCGLLMAGLAWYAVGQDVNPAEIVDFMIVREHAAAEMETFIEAAETWIAEPTSANETAALQALYIWDGLETLDETMAGVSDPIAAFDSLITQERRAFALGMRAQFRGETTNSKIIYMTHYNLYQNLQSMRAEIVRAVNQD